MCNILLQVFGLGKDEQNSPEIQFASVAQRDTEEKVNVTQTLVRESLSNIQFQLMRENLFPQMLSLVFSPSLPVLPGSTQDDVTLSEVRTGNLVEKLDNSASILFLRDCHWHLKAATGSELDERSME